MKFRFIFAALVTSVSSVASAQSTLAPVPQGSYVIENVSVLPMDREQILRNQTVVVERGVIVRVGPSKRVRVPKGALRIDGTGRYVTPGLTDMHSHAWQPEDLLLNLANGVTTVRVMWGTPDVQKLQRGVTAGAIAGPDMVVAGPMIDGKPAHHFGSAEVTNAEEAIAEVRAQKAAGYDFIKPYSVLSKPAFEAILAEAKRLSIPVAGH